MGPDEKSTSKYSMIITPLNEDGTYGESIEWSGFKPIIEEPESTIIGYVSIPLEDFSEIAGEIHITLGHAKISKKTFKNGLCQMALNVIWQSCFAKLLQILEVELVIKAYTLIAFLSQLRTRCTIQLH